MVRGDRSATMNMQKNKWLRNHDQSILHVSTIHAHELRCFWWDRYRSSSLDGSSISRQCQMALEHLIGYSSVMTSDCPIMISFNHIFGISNVKLLICISRSLAAPHLLKNKRLGERAEKIRNSAAMDTCSQGTMRLSGPLQFPMKGTEKPT